MIAFCCVQGIAMYILRIWEIINGSSAIYAFQDYDVFRFFKRAIYSWSVREKCKETKN